MTHPSSVSRCTRIKQKFAMNQLGIGLILILLAATSTGCASLNTIQRSEYQAMKLAGEAPEVQLQWATKDPSVPIKVSAAIELAANYIGLYSVKLTIPEPPAEAIGCSSGVSGGGGLAVRIVGGRLFPGLNLGDEVRVCVK